MDIDYQKKFITIINTLAVRHSRWKVWNDFLTMAAISIANTIPTKERDSREADYHAARIRYSETEQSAFAQLLGYVVMALDKNPEQDFLGELYHALSLSQEQKGQYFTPYYMCHFMARLLGSEEEMMAEVERKGYISISDPACGSGAMFIAYINMVKERNVNYQKQVLIVAQDIDYSAAMMCYIQLSLLGCNAIVIVGDTFARPGLHPDNDIWHTPMLYLNWYLFRENKESGKVKEECC